MSREERRGEEGAETGDWGAAEEIDDEGEKGKENWREMDGDREKGKWRRRRSMDDMDR